MENQKQQQEQEQQPPSTYTADELSTAVTALLWNTVACGALVHGGRHITEHQLRWLAVHVLRRRYWPRERLAQHIDGLMHTHQIELRGELVGTTLAERERPVRIARLVQSVLGDVPPATTGEPFVHAEAYMPGRTCVRLADGTGWWPRTWESGDSNRSAGSFCLGEHHG